MSTIQINNKEKTINIKIWLVHFIDNNGLHYIHSPNLDLTGYGYTKKEAKESFDIVLKEFFDYILENDTLEEVLSQLGWRVKSNSQTLINTEPFSNIKNEKFLSDIFEKYSVNSFHENIGMPMYA